MAKLIWISNDKKADVFITVDLVGHIDASEGKVTYQWHMTIDPY